MLCQNIKRRASLPENLSDGLNRTLNDARKVPNLPGASPKRRKTAPGTSLSALRIDHNIAGDDAIDPVEKLLSLTSLDDDILLRMEDPYLSYGSSTAYPSICSDEVVSPSTDSMADYFFAAAEHSMSYNFSKVINEWLRSYYSMSGKSQMEIHNDHSLFSVLTKPRAAPSYSRPKKLLHPRQVPFFKNVNFNPSGFGSKLEDYVDYKDDNEKFDFSTEQSEDESLSSNTTPLTSPVLFTSKTSFYRRHDSLDLSLTDEHSKQGLHDGYRFLNPRSILSGQASETIGAAKFMISEFFF